MEKSEMWVKIEDAPLDKPGMFWGPQVADLWARDAENEGNYPMGHLKLSERTGNRRAVTNWTGYQFTHFHPSPPPPNTVRE